MPTPLADALLGLINWAPRPVETASVQSSGAPEPLRRGEPFTVLTWNLQYCATRHYRFFYDGGPDVRPRPEHVQEALEGVSAILEREAPDLTLLQEVDRDSARTGRRDQLAALLHRRPVARWIAAPYHRCRYLPHPVRDPLGRVDFDLALLSRYALDEGTRTALPDLAEPWLRRQFNLHRALLWARIPVEGGGHLAVGVTHLSAFSRGDGTLQRQVALLVAWIQARRAAGDAVVLGGDLNLLPPGDDPARLGEAAREYADRPSPLAALLEVARPAVPPSRALAPASRTYLPPGASTPDRVLDHLLVAGDVEVLDAGPVAMDPLLSDHLPLRARLRLTPAGSSDR